MELAVTPDRSGDSERSLDRFGDHLHAGAQGNAVTWHVFDEGRTLGAIGSEGGEILHDEEHTEGARVTLERNGSIAPYSITCGVYGWMVHTRFFRTEAAATSELEPMKEALADILGAIPLASDPQVEAKSQKVAEEIQSLVERFP